jgi:hypothetical protein
MLSTADPDPPEGSMMDRQERSSNMSMVEKRYGRVSRWVRKLMDKSLVSIHICESSHWYIIVLIMPGNNNNNNIFPSQ